MPAPKPQQLAKFALGCLLLVVVAAVFFAGDGCRPSREKMTDDEVVRQVLEATQQQGNHAPLYPVDSSTNVSLAWQFHFDLSTTMNGFLKPADEKFRPLVQKLVSTMDTNATFVGEGGPSSGASLDLTQLTSPATYTQSGLDYRELFARLVSETNANHALITDGIPLRGRMPVPPLEIIAGLRQFLNRGGDITLLALRLPYKGQLTSVKRLLRAPKNADPEDLVVTVNSTGRPLLLWLFVQPGQTIGTASHPLGRLGERLELSRTNTADWTSPFGEWTCLVLPSRAQPPMSLQNAGEDSPACRAKLTGMTPVKKISILNHLEKQRLLTFSVSFPLPKDSQIPRDSLASSLALTLSAWTIPEWRDQKIVPVVTQMSPPKWELGPESSDADLGYARLVSARVTVNPERPVPPPGESEKEQFVWLASVAPQRGGALPPHLAAFSTEDDSLPTNAGAIYQLGELLKLVRDELQIHGQAVFFTRWTK